MFVDDDIIGGVFWESLFSIREKTEHSLIILTSYFDSLDHSTTRIDLSGVEHTGILLLNNYLHFHSAAERTFVDAWRMFGGFFVSWGLLGVSVK